MYREMIESDVIKLDDKQVLEMLRIRREREKGETESEQNSSV